MNVAVVIAGGSGHRMGQDIPKQFINVYDKPVIIYTLEGFQKHPQIDSLYESCLNDDRIDARLVWLDETNTEKSQMIGAEAFLKKKKLSYEKFEEFDIESFAPHVIFIQTPYDEWHRKEQHWANHFKEQGYRIVYIPYGVDVDYRITCNNGNQRTLINP